MPFLSNFLETAGKAIKRLANTLYPPSTGQEAQISSSQISQPNAKRRRTSDSDNTSRTISNSAEAALPHLPDELWVRIFNFTRPLKTELLEDSAATVWVDIFNSNPPSETKWLDEDTQFAEKAGMPQQNLREVSTKFLAMYDSMLYRQFLSTFKPAIYDDTLYQLRVNQTTEPNRGEVHLSLEEGVLKYNLQTLDGTSMQGMLSTKLESQLNEQAINDRKNDIHRELGAAVRLQEVKARLIEEMGKLFENEETILAKNSESVTLSGRFVRLKELRHGGLYQTFNLFESEHHLEQINTEIVELRIFEAYRSSQVAGLPSLDCSSCGLTRFPKTILLHKDYARFWTKLKMLYLDNNQLQSLPAEIGQLTNLMYLIANNNKLQSLPAEIGQLVALQELDLDYNRLKSLPVEMAQLRELKLFLENNRFQSLPDWLGEYNFCRRIEGPAGTIIGKVATLELQQPIDENEIEMMAPGM